MPILDATAPIVTAPAKKNTTLNCILLKSSDLSSPIPGKKPKHPIPNISTPSGNLCHEEKINNISNAVINVTVFFSSIVIFPNFLYSIFKYSLFKFKCCGLRI